VSRIVYVNGRYLPYAKAAVHVEDRGFQFADAVYEVCEVRQGRLVDEGRHMARLERSLAELGIERAMPAAALAHVMRETVRRNRVRNGLVYLQVTRGEGPREFAFPPEGTPRTVVCVARSISHSRQEALAAEGIAVKSMPDIRWRRSDIKTVMLLPACLAKDAARREGAREAWFVDSDGFVTEGASSNAWIVSREGAVITRAVTPSILAGVTRATVIDVLRGEGVSFLQRPFGIAESLAAAEAFITSATNTVMPVVRIDGTLIGDGRPGPITLRIRSKFHQYAAISGVPAASF
jgi:D-alanine transaminase